MKNITKIKYVIVTLMLILQFTINKFEYKIYVIVGALILLIPIGINEFADLKKGDQLNGTNTFEKQRNTMIFSIILITTVLMAFYFMTQSSPK